MFTTTRSMTAGFASLKAGELRKFLEGVDENSRISVSVYLAGEDPRERDELTLSVKVEN